jgi:hypothetical protein
MYSLWGKSSVYFNLHEIVHFSSFFLVGENRQLFHSRRFVCLSGEMFVCSIDTGRISGPIDLKFGSCMSNFEYWNPIVFGNNWLQGGGFRGHFVVEKIL